MEARGQLEEARPLLEQELRANAEGVLEESAGSEESSPDSDPDSDSDSDPDIHRV